MAAFYLCLQMKRNTERLNNMFRIIQCVPDVAPLLKTWGILMDHRRRKIPGLTMIKSESSHFWHLTLLHDEELLVGMEYPLNSHSLKTESKLKACAPLNALALWLSSSELWMPCCSSESTLHQRHYMNTTTVFCLWFPVKRWTHRQAKQFSQDNIKWVYTWTNREGLQDLSLTTSHHYSAKVKKSPSLSLALEVEGEIPGLHPIGTPAH